MEIDQDVGKGIEEEARLQVGRHTDQDSESVVVGRVYQAEFVYTHREIFFV